MNLIKILDVISEPKVSQGENATDNWVYILVIVCSAILLLD